MTPRSIIPLGRARGDRIEPGLRAVEVTELDASADLIERRRRASRTAALATGAPGVGLLPPALHERGIGLVDLLEFFFRARIVVHVR